MEISSLLIIAIGMFLVSFLWAASVAFTFWDARRRSLTGFELLVWVGLAVLLPFIGPGLYLFSRVLVRLLSPESELQGVGGRRSTALKREPETDRSMPTFLAAEMVQGTVQETVQRTIADPGPSRSSQAGQDTGGLKLRCFVVEGPYLGKEFLIDTLPAQIGRGPGTAIRLDEDLGVSRRHAEIYERDGTLRIRDLNSTHGTQVKGSRIEDVRLQPGDRVKVGLTVLRFVPANDQEGTRIHTDATDSRDRFKNP